MKKIEKPEWLSYNAELCKDGFVPFIAQLIDNQNELIAWAQPEIDALDRAIRKELEEEGYYWCYVCATEVDSDHGEEERHHVTGPHIDTCPECKEPMEGRYFGDYDGYQMKCATSKAHFSGPRKSTKAEAIHAWRKVIRQGTR